MGRLKTRRRRFRLGFYMFYFVFLVVAVLVLLQFLPDDLVDLMRRTYVDPSP